MISRRTRGQAAEVTEVDRIAHRPAGHADKRRALTLNVVRQLGSVKGMESRHERHPGTASTAQPINWQWPAGQVGRGTPRATATLRCRANATPSAASYLSGALREILQIVPLEPNDPDGSGDD
jgi:hypothetical protein